MRVKSVEAIVYALAIAATAFVMFLLPNQPWRWIAFADTYQTAPADPIAEIPGIDFVRLSEIVVDTSFVISGTNVAYQKAGDVVTIKFPSGSLDDFNIAEIVALLEAGLSSGQIDQIGPDESVASNAAARLILRSGSLRFYYLYTKNGTDVIQVNIYDNGLLLDDHFMLFIDPTGNVTVVYRRQ
jgi:hypothetical protein